jgi:hypothetical protein
LPIKSLANTPEQSKLLGKLDEINTKRQTAVNVISDIEKKKPDQQIAEDKEMVAQLKDLNSQFDKLNSSLVVIDEKTGVNLLTLLLKAERIINILIDSSSADQLGVLYVKVVKAGGGNRISQNLFTGSKVAHNGGSIVSYALFSDDGKVVRSGLLFCLTDYYEPQEMGQLRDEKLINNFNFKPISKPRQALDAPR